MDIRTTNEHLAAIAGLEGTLLRAICDLRTLADVSTKANLKDLRIAFRDSEEDESGTDDDGGSYLGDPGEQDFSVAYPMFCDLVFDVAKRSQSIVEKVYPFLAELYVGGVEFEDGRASVVCSQVAKLLSEILANAQSICPDPEKGWTPGLEIESWFKQFRQWGMGVRLSHKDLVDNPQRYCQWLHECCDEEFTAAKHKIKYGSHQAARLERYWASGYDKSKGGRSLAAMTSKSFPPETATVINSGTESGTKVVELLSEDGETRAEIAARAQLNKLNGLSESIFTMIDDLRDIARFAARSADVDAIAAVLKTNMPTSDGDDNSADDLLWEWSDNPPDRIFVIRRLAEATSILANRSATMRHESRLQIDRYSAFLLNDAGSFQGIQASGYCALACRLEEEVGLQIYQYKLLTNSDPNDWESDSLEQWFASFQAWGNDFRKSYPELIVTANYCFTWIKDCCRRELVAAVQRMLYPSSATPPQFPAYAPPALPSAGGKKQLVETQDSGIDGEESGEVGINETDAGKSAVSVGADGNQPPEVRDESIEPDAETPTGETVDIGRDRLADLKHKIRGQGATILDYLWDRGFGVATHWYDFPRACWRNGEDSNQQNNETIETALDRLHDKLVAETRGEIFLNIAPTAKTVVLKAIAKPKTK